MVDRMADEHRSEILYVSWGGSGRSVAFREAYARAVKQERGIVYLAILDAPTFGDLDDSLAEVVAQELTWLLEAQLRLVDREEASTVVPTRTLVRTGDVAEEVASLVEVMATDTVLLGAPIPFSDHTSVGDLVEALSVATGVAVEVVAG